MVRVHWNSIELTIKPQIDHGSDQSFQRFVNSDSLEFVLKLLTLRDARRGHLEARSLETGRPERRCEVTKMLVEELKR